MCWCPRFSIENQFFEFSSFALLIAFKSREITTHIRWSYFSQKSFLSIIQIRKGWRSGFMLWMWPTISSTELRTLLRTMKQESFRNPDRCSRCRRDVYQKAFNAIHCRVAYSCFLIVTKHTIKTRESPLVGSLNKEAIKMQQISSCLLFRDLLF